MMYLVHIYKHMHVATAFTNSCSLYMYVFPTLQVQDICFSADSRWVGVSTLNGTTHVFPISPYGGDITVRTHTPRRVVNRMSRFHTSAGMGLSTQTVYSNSNSGTTRQSRNSQSPPADIREIPSSITSGNGIMMGNNWNNPRGLLLPCPVVVSALQQIKQPYISTAGEKQEGVCCCPCKYIVAMFMCI